MIACFDVHYRETKAFAAAVLFQDWPDAEPVAERLVAVPVSSAYVPGQFFRRELPCLLALVRDLPALEIVVIDGYVWLGNQPGLGAHFYSALDGQLPIIGVAKSRFHEVPAIALTRGKSHRPLFITAAGMPPEQAANHIRSMHGPYRLPTLIKQVDHLARIGCS